MVRISSHSSRRRMRNRSLLADQYRRNRSLYGMHFLVVLLLGVVAFCGSLYFFLLQREMKTATQYASDMESRRRRRTYNSAAGNQPGGERVEYYDTDVNAEQEEQQYGNGQNNYEQQDYEYLKEGEDEEEEEAIGNEGYVLNGVGAGDGLANNNNNIIVPDTNTILSASQVLELGLPFLIYGTAWKKDRTADLVQQALEAGFRFIDTAGQPKHYNEAAVGEGWTAAAESLGLTRPDIFLQTKFTSVSGQDTSDTAAPLPYDPSLPLPDQVAASIQTSLRNLQTDYIDSYILHSPEMTIEKTMLVYRAMEDAYDQGYIRRLGIANCYDTSMFQSIYDQARIKPEILQNRFYAATHWDTDLRTFCADHDIWYQSFWTLTANADALANAHDWAAAAALPSAETLLYAYILSWGYGTPLDGTTQWEHMVEDIAVQQRVQREFLVAGDEEEKIFATEEDMRKFEELLGF